MKYIQIAKVLSIICAVLFTGAGLTSALGILIPSHILGFLLAPAFLSLVVCIYWLTDTHKFEALLSILFAVIYVVFVSFNYSLLFSFQGRNLEIPILLQATNVDSIFFVIEILAYHFMGLSTLLLIPIFKNDGLSLSIKWLFLLNAVLGIGGVIGYALSWPFPILLVGLILWNIIMPIASILLYFYFRKLEKSRPVYQINE